MNTTMWRSALLFAALWVGGSLAGCADPAVAPGDDRTVVRVQVGSAGPLVVGDTLRLSATPQDVEGGVVPGRTVTWSVENGSVVELTSAGATVRLRALAPGQTQVMATVDGVTGQTLVTVTAPPEPVDRVVVTHASGGAGTPRVAILEPGMALTAHATALRADGSEIPGLVIAWRSSDSRVVRVTASEDGSLAQISGVSAGAATVFAEVGGRSGSASVIVPTPMTPAARVEVVPGELLVELGAEVEPLAYAWNAQDGGWIENPAVVWLSEDTALVSLEGLVDGGRARLRAHAEGTTRITAYSGGKTATAEVRVRSAPGVGGVILTPLRRGLWPGETFRFTATVVAPTGGTLEGYPVRWEIEDPTVARIRADGMFSALRPGITRVRATSGGVTRTAEIQVYPQPSGPITLSLLPNVEPGGGPRVTVPVGRTTWTDESGVTHEAEKWLVGGTMTLDLGSARYQQSLAVHVVVIRNGAGNVVAQETWTDQGEVVFDLQQPHRYVLRSTGTPGLSYGAVFGEAGLLTVQQKIGSAPELGWLYAM